MPALEPQLHQETTRYKVPCLLQAAHDQFWTYPQIKLAFKLQCYSSRRSSSGTLAVILHSQTAIICTIGYDPRTWKVVRSSHICAAIGMN